jgi:hypothetical protein
MPTSGSSSRSRAIRCSAHQLQLLVRGEPGQRRSARRVQDQPGVAREFGDLQQLLGLGCLHPVGAIEGVDDAGGHLDLGHPGPAGVDARMHPVLIGREAHGGGLDPQGHVLGHQHHLAALIGQVQRHGQDAGIVALDPEAGRQQRQVRVVELDVQGAALVAHRHRRVQPAVLDPQVVEGAQGLAGEPAQLGVVTLAFQLADDHQRQDDVVLAEAGERPWIRQQHRGIQDEGLDSRFGGGGRGARVGHKGLLGAAASWRT